MKNLFFNSNVLPDRPLRKICLSIPSFCRTVPSVKLISQFKFILMGFARQTSKQALLQTHFSKFRHFRCIGIQFRIHEAKEGGSMWIRFRNTREGRPIIKSAQTKTTTRSLNIEQSGRQCMTNTSSPLPISCFVTLRFKTVIIIIQHKGRT